uniref:Uncharacterized protein n=1 Tax=Calcidiscus leptoporus TaxID=127549 RepID=A0A7S0JG59_9EUKA|mmetsp:Transcript_57058/g.131006  ORF Transcript_57058/g.131006 Transcript_57058/m.131006 type:complete len:140 (+) Transcript_57058:25-444(+)
MPLLRLSRGLSAQAATQPKVVGSERWGGLLMSALALCLSLRLVGQRHKNEDEMEEVRLRLSALVDESEARRARLLQRAPELAQEAGLRGSACTQFAASLAALDASELSAGAYAQTQVAATSEDAVEAGVKPGARKLTVW